MLTSLAVSTGTYQFLLPLLIWYTFSRNDSTDDINKTIQVLVGEELLPPAQARLEQNLGLPPRSLEVLSKISNPATFQTIQRITENNRNEILNIQTDIQGHENKLDELYDFVDDLQIQVRSADTFISDNIRNALKDPSLLINGEERRKEDILRHEMNYSEKETQSHLIRTACIVLTTIAE